MGSRSGYADRREVAETPAHPKGIVRDYVETILVCVIFVIFTRAFSFQQSKIPSGSMEDTLLIGDYIMVNRFVYAPTQFDWEKKLLPIREIRRGDIVVFKFPGEPETDYIKRVVGVPGDTIELKEGTLYVNGAKVDEPYIRYDKTASRRTEFFGPYAVKPDNYFCMGDHRNSSSDSRVWGPVRRELIKGRALLIWMSFDHRQEDAFRDKTWSFFRKQRWSRIFRLIR